MCRGHRAAEATWFPLCDTSPFWPGPLGTSWEAGPTPWAGRPPALGHLGPRAVPKSHCPLDLGRPADCEVPLGVGGWALAALWILQAPPQPALSLQLPQLQAGQDSGFPSVFLDLCSLLSPGVLSVDTFPMSLQSVQFPRESRQG